MKRSRKKGTKEVIEERRGRIATRAQAREEAPQAADHGAAVEEAVEAAEGHRTKDGSTGMRRRQRGMTTSLQVQAESVGLGN